MAEPTRVPASVTLRETAIREENAELGKNQYREDSSEYSASVVPTEIDGALTERTKLSVMNMFNESTPYKDPDAGT